jgi:hypothetical protein
MVYVPFLICRADNYKSKYATTVDPALLVKHFPTGHAIMRKHPEEASPPKQRPATASGGYHVRNFEKAVLDNSTPKSFALLSSVRRDKFDGTGAFGATAGSTKSGAHFRATHTRPLSGVQTHVEAQSPFAWGAPAQHQEQSHVQHNMGTRRSTGTRPSGVAMKLIQALATAHPMPDPTESAEYAGKSLQDIAASTEDYVSKYAEALLEAEQAVEQERHQQMARAKELLRREQALQRREAQAAVRQQLAEEIAFAREQAALMEAKEAEKRIAAEQARLAKYAAAKAAKEKEEAEATAVLAAAAELTGKAKPAQKLARPASSKHKRGASSATAAAPGGAPATTTGSSAPPGKVSDSSASPSPKERPGKAPKTTRSKVGGPADDSAAKGATPPPESAAAPATEPQQAEPQQNTAQEKQDVTLTADLQDMNRLLNPLELKQLKAKLKLQAIEEEERARAAESLTRETITAALNGVIENIEAQRAVKSPAAFRKNSSARLEAVLQQLALDADSVITPVVEEPSAMTFDLAAPSFSASASTLQTAEVVREFLGDAPSARRASAAPAATDATLTVGETLPTAAALRSIIEDEPFAGKGCHRFPHVLYILNLPLDHLSPLVHAESEALQAAAVPEPKEVSPRTAAAIDAASQSLAGAAIASGVSEYSRSFVAHSSAEETSEVFKDFNESGVGPDLPADASLWTEGEAPAYLKYYCGCVSNCAITSCVRSISGSKRHRT